MKKSFAAILIALAGVIGSAGEQIDLFRTEKHGLFPPQADGKTIR